MVGTLTFIWVTVVLLGGFAITMKESDFWVVTAILVIEGARLFSRNHQLELQHQDKNDCSGSLIRRTAQFFNCPGCSSCPDPSSHATASTRQGASHGKDTWATNSGLRQSKMRKWENLRVPILRWIEIRAVLGDQHLLPPCLGATEQKLGAQTRRSTHDPELLLPGLQHMPEPEHLREPGRWTWWIMLSHGHSHPTVCCRSVADDSEV